METTINFKFSVNDTIYYIDKVHVPTYVTRSICDGEG